MHDRIMSTIYTADLHVNWPLEDPAVLRKEGRAGPRYSRASGKSLEALLFYGDAVVGVVAGASPGGGKRALENFRVHLVENEHVECKVGPCLTIEFRFPTLCA